MIPEVVYGGTHLAEEGRSLSIYGSPLYIFLMSDIEPDTIAPSYFPGLQGVTVVVIGDNAAEQGELINLLKIILHQVDLNMSSLTRCSKNNIGSVMWRCDMRDVVYRGHEKCIVFLLFNICDQISLAKALRNSPYQQTETSQSCETYLIGNRIELEYWRRVSVIDGALAAKSIHAGYIEVSSFTGQHVDYLVDIILRAIFPVLNSDTAAENFLALLKYPLRSSNTSSAADMDQLRMDMEVTYKRLQHITTIADESRDLAACVAEELQQHASGSTELSVGQPGLGGLMQGQAVGRKKTTIAETAAGRRRAAMRQALSQPQPQPRRPCQPSLGEHAETSDGAFPVAPSSDMNQLELGVISSPMFDRIQLHETLTLEHGRGDKIVGSDSTAVQTGRLAVAEARTHSEKSGFMNGNEFNDPWCICFICTVVCGYCLAGVIFGPFYAIYVAANKCVEYQRRNSLFDTVLADTENAFQTLAAALVYCTNLTLQNWSMRGYILIGWWLELIGDAFSVCFIMIWTILLILPSFFTLLIIRTTTIEKESDSFGVRQEVIRHESKVDSFLRWVRIVLRSLPLAVYILVLPSLLVYYIFGPAAARKDKATIVVCLGCYLGGVVGLQVLGAVRVYYCWKSREDVIPSPPVLIPRNDNSGNDDGDGDTNASLCCRVGCRLSKGSAERTDVIKKISPPLPPNTFIFNNPSNIIELSSLTLEFVQMAAFSLQNSPYQSRSNDDIDSTDDESGDSTHFWGSRLFRTLYVHATMDTEAQYALMWGAVGVVGLLVIIYALQFLSELRIYGELMKSEEDKDIAKDSFFFSFTGALVYGHGIPNNISNRMRLVVAVISDALFLVVSFQLLQILSCSYMGEEDEDSDAKFASLRSNSSITCWQGRHALLATVALTAFGFYVPLSIMITPILLQAPQLKDDTSAGCTGGVSYLKLYLMAVNVIKTVMLIAVMLGPEDVITVVICSTLSSLLLGTLTVMWFRGHDISKAHYSADIHPCNIAFINYWKAASYTAAVVSAVIVAIAHILQDSMFPPHVLMGGLLATWAVVVIIYFLAYQKYEQEQKSRRQMVRNLISYPFLCRDAIDEVDKHSDTPYANKGMSGNQSQWLFAAREIPKVMKHIPGFNKSPWYDSRENVLAGTEFKVKDYHGLSLTEHIIGLNVECSD